MIKFTVPLTPVTKKNSSQIFRGKGGKPFITPSERYKQYEKDFMWFAPKLSIDVPVNVKTVFYLPTRRLTDLSNLISAAHDCLVASGTLVDDNYKIIHSVDGSRVYYDKENPRTEIEITEVSVENS
jgi:Holliday junction resolvase RusA-like endonuclease